MSWFSRMFSKNKGPTRLPAPQPTGVAVQRPRPSGLKGRSKDDLPRFHGTAADQIRLGRGGPLEQIRFRLRNAFTPSRPVVEPAMFAGRTKLLRTLIRSIEDQQLHVVLYGERGIGKTSMLHVLRQIAQEARYIVRYASCSEDTEFSEFFRAILYDIPLLYHSDYAPTSEEIEEGLSLADLLPETPLTVAHISDVFAKLSRTRVLIILDEFDRAGSPAFRRSIADLIKNLSDRSIRVQLIIAGVASNLTELVEHIPSIRRNILGLQVPNMANSEIEELIRNGESVCGLKFTREAVDFISSAAHGLPYLASLLCHHAGLAAIERQATSVKRVDAISAVEQAVEEIEHRVSPAALFHVRQAIDDGHEKLLTELASAVLHGGGRITAEQIDGIVGKAKAAEFIGMMSGRYDLLKPSGDGYLTAYAFSEEGVPLYLWIRQVARQLPADMARGTDIGLTPMTAESASEDAEESVGKR